MIKWIHHLFSPHCVQCHEESEEARICKSCEILKISLEQANAEKSRLLELVIEKNSPVIESRPAEEFKPITTNRHIPWSVRKQMLEAEDRRSAQLMREKIPITTEDLEEELELVKGEK